MSEANESGTPPSGEPRSESERVAEAAELLREAETLESIAKRVETELVARVVVRSIGWARGIATAAIGVATLLLGAAYFDNLSKLRGEIAAARESAANVEDSLRLRVGWLTDSLRVVLDEYAGALQLIVDQDAAAGRRADLLVDVGVEQAIRVAGDAASLLATRNDSILNTVRAHVADARESVANANSLATRAAALVEDAERVVRRSELDGLRDSIGAALRADLTGEVWIYDDNSAQIPGLPLVITVDNVGDEHVAYSVRIYHFGQSAATGKSSPIWGPRDVDFRHPNEPFTVCADRTEYEIAFLGMIDGDGGKQTDGIIVRASDLGACTA